MFSRFQLHNMTMDNARLLLQIDNTKLANDDLKKTSETWHAINLL